MACHCTAQWCDASAVSPGKGGPAREPCDLSAGHDWTRQGTEGFLGHPRCQGRTAGEKASRQEALNLMGGWCGAQAADATGMKTRLRLSWPIGGGVFRPERNGKKCQKLCEGEVLPLDRSLLMGDFSVVLFRQHFMLASEGYPMKVHKNQRLLTLPSPLNLPYGATNQDTYHGVWWTGCLRSDLTGDDPQRCGLTNS